MKFEFVFRRLAIVIPLWSALALLADAPPVPVSLRPGAPTSDGQPTFVLQWDAISNATYKIQARSGLEPASAWSTIDVATPQSNVGLFKVTPEKVEAGSESIRRAFFRLILPKPEITRVEPARLFSGAGNDVFLIGQCFTATDELFFAGKLLAGAIVSDGTLIMVHVSPPAPGLYDFELRRGGIAIASFS